MFNFFKNKKNTPASQHIERKLSPSELFSRLIDNEKAQLKATELLLISEPSNLCLVGIGSTTLLTEQLKADPLLPFIGDPHFGRAAYHLLVYRIINHITIYLAGRYTWDSVPSSVQQDHPQYLTNAKYLEETLISTLNLYQELIKKAGTDKDHCRMLCSLIESVLNLSNALDDNDLNRAEAERSNATVQFYRLLNMQCGELIVTTVLTCAAGAAMFVIYDRLLQYIDENETEKILLGREHGLKCYQASKQMMTNEFLAALFK